MIFIIEDGPQDSTIMSTLTAAQATSSGDTSNRVRGVSGNYAAVNMLRTIGDVSSMEPIGLNDGLAAPMLEVFDLNQPEWTRR